MSLPAPLAFALERAVSVVLALDPDSATHLMPLEGRVVRVIVEPLSSVSPHEGSTADAVSPSDAGESRSAGTLFSGGLELALSFVDGRVDVFGAFDGDADVTLRGSPAALASMAQSNDALYAGDVRVEGDVGVAAALSALIAALDIDPEEIVAPVLGGTLARRVGQGSRRARAWLGRTRAGFEQNVSEYLQEETVLLPARAEVERFAADVDQLRAAADRLDARLRRLERARVADDEAGAAQ